MLNAVAHNHNWRRRPLLARLARAGTLATHGLRAVGRNAAAEIAKVFEASL